MYTVKPVYYGCPWGWPLHTGWPLYTGQLCQKSKASEHFGKLSCLNAIYTGPTVYITLFSGWEVCIGGNCVLGGLQAVLRSRSKHRFSQYRPPGCWITFLLFSFWDLKVSGNFLPCSPHPLGISIDHPWGGGGYGYFLESHN